MELREIWKVLIRRWWLVALPAVIALAFAAYGMTRQPAAGGFSAGMRFTAATSPDAYSQIVGYEDGSYYPWLASEYVVNGLTDWVRTSTFTEAVSARLAVDGLEITSSTLEGIISADNTRSVMDVSIGWADDAQLLQIAEAVAAVLQEESLTTFPQFGEAGVEVVMLDAPAPYPVPPALTSRMEPLIRVAVGLAAGIALAFLAEYLDPALRDRAQFESLGLAIIAEIPKERR